MKAGLMHKYLVLIRPEIKKIFVAATVGLISACWQLVIFNFLRNSMSPEIANCIAIEIAIINNFLLNNQITFAGLGTMQTSLYFIRFFKFNTIALGSLVIQLLVLFIGVHFFGRGFIIENLLVIFGIGLGFVTNYLGYRFFVWRH